MNLVRTYSTVAAVTESSRILHYLVFLL